jgi:hypothetical protein
MGRVRTKLNMVINVVILTLILTLIVVVTEWPSSSAPVATDLILTTRSIGVTLVVVVLSRGVVTVFEASFFAEI